MIASPFCSSLFASFGCKRSRKISSSFFSRVGRSATTSSSESSTTSSTSRKKVLMLTSLTLSLCLVSTGMFDDVR